MENEIIMPTFDINPIWKEIRDKYRAITYSFERDMSLWNEKKQKYTKNALIQLAVPGSGGMFFKDVKILDVKNIDDPTEMEILVENQPYSETIWKKLFVRNGQYNYSIYGCALDVT